MFYAIHPGDFKHYSTAQIRSSFLLPELFKADQVTNYYTQYDRFIVGGISPLTGPIDLSVIPELKSTHYLERREIGIINVGAPVKVTTDDTSFDLDYKDALYLGMGTKQVTFSPAKEGVARLYFNSAPAHCTYPSRKVALRDADTVTLGATETSNQRTIRKLIVNSVLPTCQLQMGLTELQNGSIWNTMPPHTHDRRMEAYFYFEIPDEHRVCHFMGQPDETRHLWVKNNQAVLSPPWSIHCGAGTTNYSFIWGMAGENLDYSDMDIVKAEALQ